jgi:hypothetical protein
MNNELQIIEKNALEQNRLPVHFTNNSDAGVQIANNGVVNINVNAISSNSPVYDASISVCYDYYSLFVVGDILSGGSVGSFMVANDRALTVAEGTEQAISEQLASLNPDAIAKIKTYPTLFASVNRNGGNTDPNHMAYCGRVTDVTKQSDGIKINYQILCTFPQQRLNELSKSLDIKSASALNELSRPHWTVKPVNMVDVLRTNNINIPAL